MKSSVIFIFSAALLALPAFASAHITSSATHSAQDAFGNMTFSATVTSDTTTSALIDLEMYDAAGAIDSGSGTQEAQGTAPVDLVANTPTTCTFNSPNIFDVFWNGTFTLKVGTFSPDWSVLYDWNNAAGTYTGVHLLNAVPHPEIDFSPHQKLTLAGCVSDSGNPATTTPPNPPPPPTNSIHNGNLQVFQSIIPKSPVAQGTTPNVGAELISSGGENANNVTVHVKLATASTTAAEQVYSNQDILHESPKTYTVAVPTPLPSGALYQLTIDVFNQDNSLNAHFDIGTVEIQ